MKSKSMTGAMEEQVAQKVSEGATAASSFILGAAWVTDAEPYITVFAAVVAIVAAGAAAWSRIENARYTRAKRKKEEESA